MDKRSWIRKDIPHAMSYKVFIELFKVLCLGLEACEL
jgi:hypothetical protein